MSAFKIRQPKYRHHKPSGRAVVTLNGQDCYLGKWKSAESKAEYNRLVGEWLANGRKVATGQPQGFFGPGDGSG